MTTSSLIDEILDRARACGATMAGLANVRAVLAAPSAAGRPALRLPDGARSVLVLGLAHPEGQPELDWWGGQGGTPGNRILIGVARALEPWLVDEVGVACWVLPYHVDKGGVFLKDAAVLAGLGVIGANNLVITPRLGPQVRWKAMLLDLEPPDRVDGLGDLFDPCAGCSHPCMEACVQEAFARGRFELSRCETQMRRDEARAARSAAAGATARGRERADLPDRVVKYCRACELACPIGAERG